MSAAHPILSETAPSSRLGRPPIPHEHGAWVILYAPLVIAFAVVPAFSLWSVLALLPAVTGLFLAREAAGLLLRRRGGPGTTFWLGIYTALAAAGAVPLIVFQHRFALLYVGLLAAALFVLHSLLLLVPARKRLDRSQWGEILAVGALALTAPAAVVTAQGTLGGMAWLLWAACTLYFSSAIFNVKMMLAAVKVKGDFRRADRARYGRDNLLYHLLLLAGVMALLWVGRDRVGILVAAAYAPALIRAFSSWAHLSNKLPPLKQVGWRETALALWFMGCLIAAFRPAG